MPYKGIMPRAAAWHLCRVRAAVRYYTNVHVARTFITDTNIQIFQFASESVAVRLTETVGTCYQEE